MKPKSKPYKVTLERGLQLRIAPDGVRTLLVRYTVKGADGERQYRLPQEYGEGPGQIRLAMARAEASRIRALAREGVDWPASEDTRRQLEVQARDAAELEESLTLEQALREYVEKKRRAKDGLPLKARTRADYLAMIEPGKTSKAGKKYADGPLFQLAAKLLSSLTAADIRKVHADQLATSRSDASPSRHPSLARRDDPGQPAGARHGRA